MATSELVEKYRELVETYDLLRQRIEKAEAQKARFKSNVIEKVIGDYQLQMKELEEQLAPSEEEMFESVGKFEAERAELEGKRDLLNDAQDEIALRNVLGEYTDEEAEVKRDEVARDLDEISGRLNAIEEEVGVFREYLEKAGAMERRGASQEPEDSQPEMPELPQMPEMPEMPMVEPEFAQAGPEPQDVVEEDFAADGPVGGVSGLGVVDEGSAFDMILDDFPVAESGGGLDQVLPSLSKESGDDLKGLTELDNQWQDELADDFPPSSGFEDVLEPGGVVDDFPNLGFAEQVDDLPSLGAGGAPLIATITRRFGRPDEDRLEMRDDEISIGRGRDNQIQIKDDTKVSRYHCRVFKEQGSYYVEDNNSSNGTMVNGELITRRKLEGNEDITIGETVFRFEIR